MHIDDKIWNSSTRLYVYIRACTLICVCIRVCVYVCQYGQCKADIENAKQELTEQTTEKARLLTETFDKQVMSVCV